MMTDLVESREITEVDGRGKLPFAQWYPIFWVPPFPLLQFAQPLLSPQDDPLALPTDCPPGRQ